VKIITDENPCHGNGYMNYGSLNGDGGGSGGNGYAGKGSGDGTWHYDQASNCVLTGRELVLEETQ
jgi:hypothetical protein